METVRPCQLNQAGIAQPVLLTVGTRAGGLGGVCVEQEGGWRGWRVGERKAQQTAVGRQSARPATDWQQCINLITQS